MVTPGDERGQLILIGALLVAATILGSIVLLNTIHESPEVSTQQDSQSLVETERTVDQVKAGLGRAFLINTSMNERGEALPYAEKGGGFKTLVEEEYVTEYLNLSTTDTAGVVDVTLVGSQTGGIARQNTTDIGEYKAYNETGDPVTIIQNADAVPRLHLLVNETSSPPFTIWINQTDISPAPAVTPLNASLEISDDKVEKSGSAPGSWVCDLSGNSLVEIDFIGGVGEVRTDETYCGDLEFGAFAPAKYNVTFENGNGVKGTYTITAVNPDSIASFPGDDYRWNRTSSPGTTYIVNPIFQIEYLTPNVEYSATYAPYNRTAP